MLFSNCQSIFPQMWPTILITRVTGDRRHIYIYNIFNIHTKNKSLTRWGSYTNSSFTCPKISHTWPLCTLAICMSVKKPQQICSAGTKTLQSIWLWLFSPNTAGADPCTTHRGIQQRFPPSQQPWWVWPEAAPLGRSAGSWGSLDTRENRQSSTETTDRVAQRQQTE